MRVVVIGGTGHIGTYLVPRLVQAGHEVVVVTRGERQAYRSHPAWRRAQAVEVDRRQAEQEGVFGERIAGFNPQVVIDLISFTLDSTRQLVDALQGRVQHFLHCGSIWVKGYVVEAPTREETPAPPIDDYGINKQAIEDYLLDLARRGEFPATTVNPGHIVGTGWPPINPLGNLSLEVWRRLAHGEPLAIPNFGMETLHHVHADDVAQVFLKAMLNWSTSMGEAFFAVSPAAVTLKGFAVEAAGWFGQEADLRFLPWEEWTEACGLTESYIQVTHSHLIHCQCCSIDKARRLLDYQPRYTSFEAVRESVEWLLENQVLVL